MTSVLKIQQRGQITLPKQVREKLGLRPGDSVICFAEGTDAIRLEKFPKMTFEEMFGSWRSKEPTDSNEVEGEIRLGMEDAADEVIRKLDG